MDDFSAGVPAHTWVGGVALGLSTRGDDRTGVVYPPPEEDCYGNNSCYRVLQACAQRPGDDVRCGSISVPPDAQWQAVRALGPLAPLLGDSHIGYFNEAYDTYVNVGCTIERVAADRPSAAFRDAVGAVSELTALQAERKALLKALAAAAAATNGLTIEPALCTTFFADGVCAHAPRRFLHVRRV